MANPQPDKFIKISNEYWDALMKVNLPAYEDRVLKAVIRQTWGYGRKEAVISNKMFVKMTMIKHPHISRAVVGLLDKNMILCNPINRKSVSYSVQKNYEKWQIEKQVRTCRGTRFVPTEVRMFVPELVRTFTLSGTNPLFIPLYVNTILKTLYSRNSSSFDEQSPPFKVSHYLYTKIKERNPKLKTPNFQTWAKHADYILRLDKRSYAEVISVVDWCQKDDFWQNNILSTKKLRDQYDQLYMKMSKSNKGDWQENEFRKFRQQHETTN